MSSGLGFKSVLAVAAPVVVAVAALGAVTGGAALTAITAASLSQPSASAAARADIPAAMLTLYQQADQQVCPQMPWQILAGIGTVESANGTSSLPGVKSGSNAFGAEGPMQFEPATFAAYDEPVPPGGANPPSPYNAVDAVYAAARMLCANGARAGNTKSAVFAYNHSDTYVTQVWDVAVTDGMAADGTPSPTPGPVDVTSNPGFGAATVGGPAAVIDYALTQLGVPYEWGGTTPGVGLDCSGLVQLSYRAAGINLPRTTYAQATYGVTVPVADLQSADLLFFNDGTPLGHVAIYLGHGLMIQAPRTGTVVSITTFNPTTVELARRIINS